jgi:2-methylcitrate dehydratase PrpD
MITDTLSRFVAETGIADIPDAVFVAAQNALIDTLGVALAGVHEPAANIAARWVEENGSRTQATIWGRALAASAAEAAFVNGTSAHALDFDDSHPSARGHASASLVPSAVAAGEVVGASGRGVLAAYAIGLEVAAKIGRMFGHGHLQRGWHPTASVGLLGSTAVAARLWGLDAGELARAWGLAGSQVGGLARNFGTMTKPFHAGHAARNGLLSAWMAKRGFTADDAIFDSPGGVFAVYGGDDGEPAESVMASLGAPWEILDPGNFVKRWPCCYSNHRALGGLYTLIDKHRLRAEEISEVAIGFLPGGDRALVSRNPKTGLEGKFSIEYVIAAALLDGPITLGTFTDAMVQRPAVQALMKKVRRFRLPDAKIYSGIAGHNDISVTTPRGSFALRAERVPGSPAWPMTAPDRAVKFIDCAEPMLGKPGAEHLLERIKHCVELSDIRELTIVTVPSYDSAKRTLSLFRGVPAASRLPQADNGERQDWI